jgi:hypothetical protein
MSIDPNDVGAELSSFIAAAGDSLTSAQDQLASGLDLQAGLILANAEIEVKVGVKTDSRGRLNIQTISAQEIRQGGINADTLSTLRINFVATAPEVQAPPLRVEGPIRVKDEVIDELRKQPDLVALDKIFGGLQYQAVYVSESKRWLVTALDPNQRVVREVVLPDK